ncbi:MAG: hypothetical protein LKJ21_09820 [Oscillospiraceae bacterium]|jgi:ribosomal protein L20|nr:hypothetical protein [Oscillospiraceae bacterium]MCI1991253.1 hypothetical protein [Oscillospiraceae bacterium]MCI2036135.1 hypothetical protein [Oscillospiraceae bacterium]
MNIGKVKRDSAFFEKLRGSLPRASFVEKMVCANQIRYEEMNELRLRKQALGTRNLVGARVEMARKNQGMKQKELLAQLQVNGVDMNASGLSKLEGQIRYVTDFELSALANILNVSVDWLLGREK